MATNLPIGSRTELAGSGLRLRNVTELQSTRRQSVVSGRFGVCVRFLISDDSALTVSPRYLHKHGGSVVQWLGRRTCDREVASSTPGRVTQVNTAFHSFWVDKSSICLRAGVMAGHVHLCRVAELFMPLTSFLKLRQSYPAVSEFILFCCWFCATSAVCSRYHCKLISLNNGIFGNVKGSGVHFRHTFSKVFKPYYKNHFQFEGKCRDLLNTPLILTEDKSSVLMRETRSSAIAGRPCDAKACQG